MSNGIYTDPIPIRDPNQDLQFLAGVLQNQAALRAKNDLSRQKALNDERKRLDKLADDRYDFDLSEIPSGFRQAFSDKLIDSQQKFKYFSSVGEDQAAMQEVLSITNDFANMKAYGEQYEPLAENYFQNDLIARGDNEQIKASATQEKTGAIGVVFDKNHYTSERADQVQSIANGSVYDLKYDPQSGRYVFGALPKDNFQLGIIDRTTEFRDAFAGHLVLNNLTQLVDRKFDSEIASVMGGATYGSRFIEYIDDIETTKGAEQAITEATEDFNRAFDVDFNNPNSFRGQQIRMQALAQFQNISRYMEPIDQERFIRGDFGGEIEEGATRTNLQQFSKELKDTTRKFLLDQMYNFYDIKPDGSGRGKSTATERKQNIRRQGLNIEVGTAFTIDNTRYDADYSILMTSGAGDIKEAGVVTVKQENKPEVTLAPESVEYFVEEGNIRGFQIRGYRFDATEGEYSTALSTEKVAIPDVPDDQQRRDFQNQLQKLNDFVTRYYGLNTPAVIQEVLDNKMPEGKAFEINPEIVYKWPRPE